MFTKISSIIFTDSFIKIGVSSFCAKNYNSSFLMLSVLEYCVETFS